MGDGHLVALFIVDDCTNMCYVFTCHSRDDQVPILETFVRQTVSGLGFKVKKVSCSTRNIRSDNAGEFTSGMYKAMLSRIGAHAEYTEPDTPQQNGRVERKIQEVTRSARALRQAAS